MSNFGDHPMQTVSRMFTRTFTTTVHYEDPFNAIEVDVLFEGDGGVWRVPAFWAGDHRWIVRFAPPKPGIYAYRLECSDRQNRDLNGAEGCVEITPYSGENSLLRRGALRISKNGRHFEHADGTPFYWLGDTWYQGLSTRLDWDGFKRITLDRCAKGFTLVQLAVGLVPIEELAPCDPGFCNEGGSVWDADFTALNPKYFDFADRRIEYLIENGIVPGLVGSWGNILAQAGAGRIRQHWRYIVARYGAYPVFWILGGEILDPPEDTVPELEAKGWGWRIDRGWTEIARYLRSIDPYHHPLSTHEAPPGADYPLQDETLLDFNLLQIGHSGWSLIPNQVRKLVEHYGSTPSKPVVLGEIGYERLGELHLEDFQRTAFWLSMLNGAAGHIYGANGVWEFYSSDGPLHRKCWSFFTWQEGMTLPGGYQVGLGSKLLRKYRWWAFEPRQDWVAPRGAASASALDSDRFDLPYAAGIAGEVRFIFTAMRTLAPPAPPTVLKLERGVAYRAYFWEPTSGIRIDLGKVQNPGPGPTLLEDPLDEAGASVWRDSHSDLVKRSADGVSVKSGAMSIVEGVARADVSLAVDAIASAGAVVIVRFADQDNHVRACYDPARSVIYLVQRRKGVDSPPTGETVVETAKENICLRTEVRGAKAIVSLSCGEHSFATPIVDIFATDAGGIGVAQLGAGDQQVFRNFEARALNTPEPDADLERTFHDARGQYRGELVGPELPISLAGWDIRPEASWSDFGRDKHILLDAYRPERYPVGGDWLLVLETEAARRDRSDAAFFLSRD